MASLRERQRAKLCNMVGEANLGEEVNRDHVRLLLNGGSGTASCYNAVSSDHSRNSHSSNDMPHVQHEGQSWEDGENRSYVDDSRIVSEDWAWREVDLTNPRHKMRCSGSRSVFANTSTTSSTDKVMSLSKRWFIGEKVERLKSGR